MTYVRDVSRVERREVQGRQGRAVFEYEAHVHDGARVERREVQGRQGAAFVEHAAYRREVPRVELRYIRRFQRRHALEPVAGRDGRDPRVCHGHRLDVAPIGQPWHIARVTVVHLGFEAGVDPGHGFALEYAAFRGRREPLVECEALIIGRVDRERGLRPGVLVRLVRGDVAFRVVGAGGSLLPVARGRVAVVAEPCELGADRELRQRVASAEERRHRRDAARAHSGEVERFKGRAAVEHAIHAGCLRGVETGEVYAFQLGGALEPVGRRNGRHARVFHRHGRDVGGMARPRRAFGRGVRGVFHALVDLGGRLALKCISRSGDARAFVEAQAVVVSAIYGERFFRRHRRIGHRFVGRDVGRGIAVAIGVVPLAVGACDVGARRDRQVSVGSDEFEFASQRDLVQGVHLEEGILHGGCGRVVPSRQVKRAERLVLGEGELHVRHL